MKAKVEKKFVPLEPAEGGKDVDWSKAQRAIFPNLKPSTETISLRMPVSMLNEIKVMANKRDVPYQSLIKMILAEKIAKTES
jgi:predicted DNA binding CopG/RHH family protein